MGDAHTAFPFMKTGGCRGLGRAGPPSEIYSHSCTRRDLNLLDAFAPERLRERQQTRLASLMKADKPKKRIFLVDAMGYIFRAFYAPMPMRLRNAQGRAHERSLPLCQHGSQASRRTGSPITWAWYSMFPRPRFATSFSPITRRSGRPCPTISRSNCRSCAAIARPCACRRSNPGYEADDVIGTLAHAGREERISDVYIVTSDKDLMQLVGGRRANPEPGQGRPGD